MRRFPVLPVSGGPIAPLPGLPCSRFPWIHFALLLVLLSPTRVAAGGPYFYHDRPYGSEALYNPMTVILNASYDIIQLENKSRKVFSIGYWSGVENVAENLASPLGAISTYGWENFIRREVLPLSFSVDGGQWWPNYTLHLIGGGMTYVGMREWYETHGFASPVAWSLGTMAAYHFLNEFVEAAGYTGVNVDPIADIYLFDIGGILLFTNDDVCRFFSETVRLADWSMQPSLALTNWTLQNNGQYFSAKWELPFAPEYDLLYYFGLRGLLGVSRKFDDGTAVSVAAGAQALRHQVVDPAVNAVTVDLGFSAGLFYDRNNSLLFAVLINPDADTDVTVNLYPGVIDLGGFSPGVWAEYSTSYGVAVGVTTVWTPGVAVTSR